MDFRQNLQNSSNYVTGGQVLELGFGGQVLGLEAQVIVKISGQHKQC
jgi:hypothetical protein